MKPDSLYPPFVSRGERIGHDSCPTRRGFDLRTNPNTGHALMHESDTQLHRVPKIGHVPKKQDT